MQRKAIFFDRDGTINVEKHYLYKIEDFEYLQGAKEGLKLLQDAGYLLVIITNQSGIAKGFYTEEDFKKLNVWMLNDLAADRIDIAACYYCPHHPDALIEKYRKDCSCRKPGVKLFMQAVRALHIDLEGSYAVGDKMRDLEICKRSAVKGFLLYSNSKEGKQADEMNIKRIQGGILEAAEDIQKENEHAALDKGQY
ncbi:D-glycero-alpha-D-manno-heptose-1,7-bisphosphate 7-phosphatase [Parablautia muri]|uniref:D,D-heptose 1,7-bisphosphate phosphatase n=1 Tax=Parablautia muri TaxID=2320879 RepID=A0A9X5GR87_9FIRM|nr:HAD family hydrolase [Parablautia muri]NBJ92064.1 HAD family hydrolase [Parablautia muri]